MNNENILYNLKIHFSYNIIDALKKKTEVMTSITNNRVAELITDAYFNIFPNRN